MDGILNISKQSGITSYGVVARVRRLTGEKRVGHAGTLDPAATGVLPVCLGQATRVVEFLAEAAKRYRAEIELGVSTDTYDAEGTVVRRSDPAGIGREQLDSALMAFQGTIQQVPPMYSALKHKGQTLYALARAGIEVERSARPVTVYSILVIDWQAPVATVEVACSKGTYIRSLANDLGEALGCGACLKSLVRLSYGPFDMNGAVSLPQLEDAVRQGDWQQFLHPIDHVLRGLTRVAVNDDEASDIGNGRPVMLASVETEGVICLSGGLVDERPSFGDYCRVYDAPGVLLAVMRFHPADGLWHPYKVFHR